MIFLRGSVFYGICLNPLYFVEPLEKRFTLQEESGLRLTYPRSEMDCSVCCINLRNPLSPALVSAAHWAMLRFGIVSVLDKGNNMIKIKYKKCKYSLMLIFSRYENRKSTYQTIVLLKI